MRIPDIIRTTPKILARMESAVLLGAPGIGKTAISYDIAEALDADVQILHPAYDEPVDYKGLPVPMEHNKQKVMHWVPPDNLPLEDILDRDPERNILLVFDDMPQAHPQVQNALARAFHAAERLIAGRKLHKQVYVMATGNRVEDAAAVYEMPSFVRGRVHLLDVEVNAEDWSTWAATRDDIPEEFYSFIHPQNKLGGSKHLFDFDPARRTNCTPRTLHIAAGDWVALKSEAANVIDGWLDSIVCPAFSIEFRAHIRLYEFLPDINAILAGKEVKMDFVERPDVLHLVLSSLIKRAKSEHAPALAQFLKRIPKNRADFAVWFYLDLRKAVPAIAGQAALRDWALDNKELLKNA